MFNKKTIVFALITGLFIMCGASAESLEDNWSDFLHYTKIGQFEMAAGHAQTIVNSNPDPVHLLKLSEQNTQGYAILLNLIKSSHLPSELAELSRKLRDIIDEGRFSKRTDPKIIVSEIERLLTSTKRGRRIAARRLRDSGEYSVKYMLDAMANAMDKKELANIIWALPQIGKDAIRPLASALQTGNIAVKAEIIKAMGAISYPQSLAHLKYVIEKDDSDELVNLAKQSVNQIDPAALKLPAAQLFYLLGENYYYHVESLVPAEGAEFANIWFWDSAKQRLTREKVDKSYFNELMAMRACEWSLKADPGFAGGKAIGLWLAAYFKAESTGVEMPDYFEPGHANVMTYATTAGPEYLHQTLARAVKDKSAYVALGAVEALAKIAGEKSLLYRLGPAQPLAQALSFDDKAVKYSAAIAIAAAGPKESFAESKLVVENLAQAVTETSENITEKTDIWNSQLADSYALRAARVMLKLSETQNPVIDLSAAQSTLINATTDSRPQIKILAGQILARLTSPNAQRAIAKMALDESNAMDVRIAAFKSLTTSAKFNANLLDNKTVDAIYSLLRSQQMASDLGAAAASAYGALNLPSDKVKDLILDQARK